MTGFIQDKQLTIALDGEIDHHRARKIMEELTNKINEYVPKLCILDFREVSFMDSSGIAVVICAVRRMRELGGTVELRDVPKQPGKILSAAGIQKIVKIKNGGVCV